jgi:hypothetical protein
MTSQRYAVTYAFNGYLDGAYAVAVMRVRETLAEMRDEGIDVDFLGATQEINAAGQLVEMTARYAAPSKGAVGRLNCRACLPATGGPRRETGEPGETDARNSIVETA